MQATVVVAVVVVVVVVVVVSVPVVVVLVVVVVVVVVVSEEVVEVVVEEEQTLLIQVRPVAQAQCRCSGDEEINEIKLVQNLHRTVPQSPRWRTDRTSPLSRPRCCLRWGGRAGRSRSTVLPPPPQAGRSLCSKHSRPADRSGLLRTQHRIPRELKT